MSCLPRGSDNNSAAHCPLKASQSIPSKLVDTVRLMPHPAAPAPARARLMRCSPSG
jgi:hypothetical protein